MRAVPLALAVNLMGVMLLAFIGAARAEAPSPLPDLSVSPENIEFTFYGDPMDMAFPGMAISVDVTVHNAGPGNSSCANVTLFIDGAYSATMHVMENMTAEYPGNASTVHFIWDTTGAGPGNHTIRAVANDTAGDAAPADNGAEKTFLIIPETPDFTMSLSPSNQEATVTPDKPGSALFEGTIDMGIGGWPQATVYLTARVDTGWVVSIAPTSMVFTQDERRTFNVSVLVPEASPASKPGSLKVECRMQASGIINTSTTMVSQAIVTVKPYYRISVEMNESERNVTLGGQAAFVVRIWNLGNSVDSFKVDVDNREELENAGWNILLRHNGFSRIFPGEYRRLTITAIASREPALTRNDRVSLKLTVSSLNANADGAPVNKTVVLTVNEKGFNMPGMMGIITIIAVIILAAAAVVFKKRGHKKEKTVKDYLKELNIEQGD
jgi:hypothetical protein